jgi:hypothetical protein
VVTLDTVIIGHAQLPPPQRLARRPRVIGLRIVDFIRYYIILLRHFIHRIRRAEEAVDLILPDIC